MPRISRRLRLSAFAFVVAVAAVVVQGLVLADPGGSVASAGPYAYVARPGDTVDTIARKARLTRWQVAQYNGLRPPFRVHVDGMYLLSRPVTTLPPFAARIERIPAGEVAARAGCPVAPSSLRRVVTRYYGFDGKAHLGRITVHASIAPTTVRIFRTLYDRRFPVQQLAPLPAPPRPVPPPAQPMPIPTVMPTAMPVEPTPAPDDFLLHEHSHDEEATPSATPTPTPVRPVVTPKPTPRVSSNMTGAYVCRLKTGSTTSLSEHSYGTSIDINPAQNPYVRAGRSLYPAGQAYIDRRQYRPGMIHAAGVARVFTAHGLRWGGQWRSTKDYMHFSVTGR